MAGCSADLKSGAIGKTPKVPGDSDPGRRRMPDGGEASLGYAGSPEPQKIKLPGHAKQGLSTCLRDGGVLFPQVPPPNPYIQKVFHIPKKPEITVIDEGP